MSLLGASIQPDEARVDWPGVVLSFADHDLLIYQAGADPHIRDKLGGFLCTEGPAGELP